MDYCNRQDNNDDRTVLFINNGESDPAWSSTNIGDSGAGLNGIRSAKAADIDNDGDIDVLTISHFTGKIHMHENTTPHPGFANSFTPNDIAVNIDLPRHIYSIDLDRDGDIDICFWK